MKSAWFSALILLSAFALPTITHAQSTITVIFEGNVCAELNTTSASFTSCNGNQQADFVGATIDVGGSTFTTDGNGFYYGSITTTPGTSVNVEWTNTSAFGVLSSTNIKPGGSIYTGIVLNTSTTYLSNFVYNASLVSGAALFQIGAGAVPASAEAAIQEAQAIITESAIAHGALRYSTGIGKYAAALAGTGSLFMLFAASYIEYDITMRNIGLVSGEIRCFQAGGGWSDFTINPDSTVTCTVPATPSNGNHELAVQLLSDIDVAVESSSSGSTYTNPLITPTAGPATTPQPTFAPVPFATPATQPQPTALTIPGGSPTIVQDPWVTNAVDAMNAALSSLLQTLDYDIQALNANTQAAFDNFNLSLTTSFTTALQSLSDAITTDIQGLQNSQPQPQYNACGNSIADAIFNLDICMAFIFQPSMGLSELIGVQQPDGSIIPPEVALKTKIGFSDYYTMSDFATCTNSTGCWQTWVTGTEWDGAIPIPYWSGSSMIGIYMAPFVITQSNPIISWARPFVTFGLLAALSYLFIGMVKNLIGFGTGGDIMEESPQEKGAEF